MKRTQVHRVLAVGVRLLTLVTLLSGPLFGNVSAQVPQPVLNSDSWTIYLNKVWGYSLEFPQGWSAGVAFTNPETAPPNVIRQGVTLADGADTYVLVDTWLSYGLGLMGWLSKYQAEMLRLGGVELPSAPNALLDGRDAVVLMQYGNGTHDQIFYAYVDFHDRVLRVTYVAADGGKGLQTYRRILASLKDLTSAKTLSPKVTTNIPELAFVAASAAACSAVYKSTCCGESSGSSKWPCAVLSGADKGNCTWWASHERSDVGLDSHVVGNAGQWASQASSAGFPVDTSPRVGDIMVIESDPGHVAYVTSVNNSQVGVTEMNWCYTCKQSNTYSTSGKKFIHRKGDTSCPDSGDVVLYYDWNYGCAGRGENSGWVRRNGTGFQNVPGEFDNKASSIRIRSGWSVKLYESPDRGGGWACRTGNDDNFAGDSFINGLSLNDNVSSFEVFGDNRCGQPDNRAPNSPSLQSPHDWYVAKDGRAPTLCWNNPGDPDGDSVQFYAEVYGSAVNANSGWQNGTCWRPGSLDGQYYTYQWHVKAKDSHGAESGWSTTWHFTVEAPDAPPSISFNTANGNGDGQITSRDRNWTFAGTASDPEGRLGQIEFRCSGDNCGYQASHTDGGDWSHTQNDVAGQNDVYFVAHDNPKNQQTASRHLDLRIDLTVPATTLSLNNEGDPARWPAWFTGPVQLRLHADDGNTGRARSGVKEVHYRLDGGGWQTGGNDVVFTVSNDGAHTVGYYAVDNVGNQEGSRTVNFQVDKTPPNPPSGVSETHGVVSNQWQKAQNTPTFTWAEASDATSGLAYYQFYFGPDPNGEAYQTFRASDPRQWTPQPGGVRTGTYYLRGRTRDNAGNWSAWTNLFTFRYDGTPPENPSGVTHAAGIANDTWQRTTNLADFTWTIPHDEGSGIKGYSVYWGTDPAGTSSNFITANQYQSPTPLCGTNEACSGYLRLRSADNVDNQANDWTTAFVLRYDNAPPTVDFTINGGVTQTTQTLLHLQIAGSDQGSGVRGMRLSGDGQAWTAWEVYAAERLWTIPAISRQWWPVYLQVRDGVGLESDVISHTIYLDVNPRQPRSENFRLFDHALSAGAGAYTSTIYTGRGTAGQVADSAQTNSLNYVIVGGYEAGSQALPIVEPGHDEFTFINSIFASGTGADTLHSTLYQMAGTLGEVGLPNNEITLRSQGHQHQPGFLAAAPPRGTPTPTPTPGPTPTPTPTPACEFPQISINNGALFTKDDHVTLRICAPRAQEMMLSNDGGFPGAQWEPYAESKPWVITTYGQYVLPRFVYAAFKDADGTIHSTYFDDIIYDPTPPSGTISVGDSVQASGANALVFHASRFRPYVSRLGDTVFPQPIALLSAQDNGAVDIYVNAQDDNSGLADMQISASADFSGTTWEPYSALQPWTPSGGDGIKTVYARFRDTAGNISTSANAQFVVDTTAPASGLMIGPDVVGPRTVTMTLQLDAGDNLSGVTDMHVSEDPTFANTPWQPYLTEIAWQIPSVPGQHTIYIQYRDLAGNVSTTYYHTYLFDNTPPVLYAEVSPGSTLTRTLTILSYDESSGLGTMRLSNDPQMIEGVVTLPYTPTVTWGFDERRVVWVQLEDSVGNVTEPYPAYAAPVCPTDMDNDGDVDVADIMQVASRWRCKCGDACYDSRYDLDGDCDIDIVDIMKVAAHWGETCGGAAGSPSPSPGRPEASTQNPTVHLAPADSTVAAGSTFTVTVMIEDALNLGAFQFDLHYSPASVQIEAITLGSFLASTGRTAASAGPRIDNVTGFASFAGFSFATPPGPNGSGTLALVRLRAVGAGTSPLDLQKVQVLDTQVNSYVPTVADGRVTVGGEHKIHLPLIMKDYQVQP